MKKLHFFERKNEKMRERRQIEKDALRFEVPPKDYNLLEIHCFLVLKQLLVMYWNKQISSERAGKVKQQVFADYEKRWKEYDFWESVFREKVDGSNKTAGLRMELRNKMNGEEEVTDGRLAEMLNMALEIISMTYKESF